MEIEKLRALTEARYRLTPLVLAQAKDMGGTFNEVVKTHLVTELFLEELIKLAIPDASKAFLDLKLSYKQKLDFAAKLNLTEGYELLENHTVGSLRKLNKMRNDFSHRLGHTVTNQEIEELYVSYIDSTKDLYGGDLPMSEQPVAVGRYLFFIFGCMFPKYEFDKNA
jgi:hypothetical protein